MELILILIYVAFCYAIFKIFRIPVNQWSLATATLGGIVGIALLLLVMNYNHPYTKEARIYFSVTPIMAGVKGRVIEVPVQPNTPLKEGDVLFRIDPRPYQYVVDQAKAMLAESQQNVEQLKASLHQASAEAEKAAAQVQLAQQNYDRQATLYQKQVVAKVTLDTYTRNIEAANQNLAGARAAEEKARLAYTSNVGGVNTAVAKLQAELRDAEFDLDQTTVHAPTDGFVTQVALRPGMYTVPAPLRPVMVFVNTGKQDNWLVGAFQQNSLQRVMLGDHAEIAFDAVPGQIFNGKVAHVLNVIAAGQLQATGALQDYGASSATGDRALAEIQITDDISSYQIPLGSAAQVAILTEHWHHVALLRRILLRIKSWQNYIFVESHGGGGGGPSH